MAISPLHSFSLKLGSRHSTNTKAELLALWAILRVCFLMGLPILMIFGDSMVVISWINQLAALDIPSLMHWCDDIKYMLQFVPQVSFKHIFREHNMQADDLSKKALEMDMGSGYFTGTLNGMVIHDGLFSLF